MSVHDARLDDAMIPTHLFLTEEEVAALVLGPGRVKEWPELAAYLENKRGFPKVDPLMGGRYRPSVELFFQLENGIPSGSARQAPAERQSRIPFVPFVPDGPEFPDAEKTRTADRRRRSVRS